MKTDQSHEQYIIRTTLQTCFDAGADHGLMQGIIAMFRRRWMDHPQLRAFVDDMEVRYITSLEGGMQSGG